MICSWTLEQELFYDQTRGPRLAEKGEKPGREGETKRCLIRELEPGSRSESSSVRERGVQSVRDRSGGFPV